MSVKKNKNSVNEAYISSNGTFRPKVCILLAAYNGESTIDSQIESIVNQEDVELEVFISVDLSSDKTLSICSNLEQKDSRIKILSYGDTFGGAAPNFFRLMKEVDFTDFDYIGLADQDDIWNPDKISRASKSLIVEDAGGYSSNVTAFWSDGSSYIIDKAQPQVEWDYLFESPGPGCTFLLTKHLAQDLKDFLQQQVKDISHIWMHDWFIYAFARSKGYGWFIDSYSSMQYRQHDNNQLGVSKGYRALLYRARFILSGEGLAQSIIIASVCGLSDNPTVKKWHSRTRLGILSLALNSKKCRRKSSDQVWFFLSTLALFFWGA